MSKKKLSLGFWMGLIMLVAAGLACSLPVANTPKRPPTPVPLSTEEIQQLEQKLESTLQSAGPDTEVTITITDQELNTFLASDAAQKSTQNQIISDPQIHLASGHIEVYGKVSMGNNAVDAVAIVVPNIDANGKPKLKVQSINVGPIPVPDSLVSQADQQVENALAEYLAANAPDLKVKSIDITEGQMTVTGTRQ